MRLALFRVYRLVCKRSSVLGAVAHLVNTVSHSGGTAASSYTLLLLRCTVMVPVTVYYCADDGRSALYGSGRAGGLRMRALL